VTKWLYDLGWRGINIEPQKMMHELLCIDRPLDVNLNLGVSNTIGFVPFYQATDSVGISTMSARWRDDWSARDGHAFTDTTIFVTTLDHICRQYVDREIDFLKIDAEGHEAEVLEGFDLKFWRPRVMLIEGNPPNLDRLIDDVFYTLAHFDGINRYYVRDEDQAILRILRHLDVRKETITFHHKSMPHQHQLLLNDLRRMLADEKARADRLEVENSLLADRNRHLASLIEAREKASTLAPQPTDIPENRSRSRRVLSRVASHLLKSVRPN